MLSRLSIRDIVLIERLDIDFAPGLSVLTGETGAGESILLDALSLALGARGDASLVRHGAAQGQVSAVFDVPRNHPARALLAENAIDDDGDIILRRVQTADGRTRVFVTLMPTRFFSKIRNRGGVYVDISVEGKMIRVFNLHLVLAHPTWRLKEFETAMFKRDPALPTIVCGDFNILSARHITPLNWILGGSLGDALLPGRERTTIDKRFAEHQLTNPLSGTITQTPSYSQLDHILVSSSFSIKSAEVIPDRHGSDHHPIRVEIE